MSTPFDVTLPLTGTPGVECRTGGTNHAYQIVVMFPRAVTIGNAQLTGTGTITSRTMSADGTQATINLTGVANGQTVIVTLNGITDGTVTSNNVNVGMTVLTGDTNGDGFVDAVDTAQVKSQSGNAVTAANCREDLNIDGFVDAVDTASSTASWTQLTQRSSSLCPERPHPILHQLLSLW